MAIDETLTNVVNLSGPITLYESSEVRDTLLAAMSQGKNLRIDLETSGPWDLSGLQLLISAVASGRKVGRSVRLINVPGVCREIGDRSGLSAWLAAATDSFL